MGVEAVVQAAPSLEFRSSGNRQRSMYKMGARSVMETLACHTNKFKLSYLGSEEPLKHFK